MLPSSLLVSDGYDASGLVFWFILRDCSDFYSTINGFGARATWTWRHLKLSFDSGYVGLVVEKWAFETLQQHNWSYQRNVVEYKKHSLPPKRESSNWSRILNTEEEEKAIFFSLRWCDVISDTSLSTELWEMYLSADSCLHSCFPVGVSIAAFWRSVFSISVLACRYSVSLALA